jgi:RNA polymerase sigma-70 factor (ECF subfamily)
MECPQGSTPSKGALEQEIARLYESEAPAVLRYAATVAGNPETAQDALQEAFFRFFIARSAGQQFQSPKAWLFRVVRNYIVDQKRAFSRHETGIESAVNVPSPLPDGEAGITSTGLLQRAAQIGLSPREVDCFRLRSQGLRYEDIAGVLGLRSGTVGALLARAHGKIRQALGEEGRKTRGFALPVARENRYAS